MKFKEQKTAEIRNQLDLIIEDIETYSKKGFKLHEVERHLFSSLLSLGLELLRYYIYLVAKLVNQQGVRLDAQGRKMRQKGIYTRCYFSIFGRLDITRTKYYSTTLKTCYIVDEALGLPSGRFSYLLEDWMAFGAVEMDFEQSVSYLERILGHRLHGMQSNRCTYHLSEQVENFYEQRQEAYEQTSTHLSVGFDGKGIPIICSQSEQAQESKATRLSKGQNRDVKKEATVSVSSCFTAKKRSAEQLIEALFSKSTDKPKSKAKPKHQWHEQKHIRAFLSNKQKAISYGIEDLLKRDQTRSGQTGQKPIIVLIDGDRALEKAVKETLVQKQITHRVEACILDFIHLLEYIWKVANAYRGEKDPGREEWVKQQALLLLNSEWKQVLAQWKDILAKERLSTTQAYNVQRAITYLSNRPHMIDYKTYLEKGYPITTGAVESACGHFVKTRMDANAMHWGRRGAQKMLNIRAVKKNGNWNEYLDSFIDHEQRQLYQWAA